MVNIRISEVLGKKVPKKRSSIARIGLLITGALSLVVVLATVYGQYAGNSVISMTNSAKKKGITISESLDCSGSKSSISFEPINRVEDILEGSIDFEAAENTDGLYYVEGNNYFAYTFYIKNSGVEVVDINYTIRITQEQNNLGNAAMFRVKESIYVDNNFVLNSNNLYSKQFSKSKTLKTGNFSHFLPGAVRKYTMFVWLDGQYTDLSMMGGHIKFDWTFSIANSGS